MDEARTGQVELDANEAHMIEVVRLIEQRSLQNSIWKKKSLQARYYYGIIFSVINLLAWVIRDYGEHVSVILHYTKACRVEETDCSRKMGVLRVSMGCFIYFCIMLVSTSNASKLGEARNGWHSGGWPLKIIMLIISVMIPFFIPSKYIHFYGEVAQIGAGVFLILQLISVIEFITWLDSRWMPNEAKQSICSIGLLMSMLFYVGSACGIIAMYPMYASSRSCYLNIFFISWTAILFVVMMVVSLHSKVNRGLLSSGIMASYLVYLCWSAIRSEPASEKCSPQSQQNGHGHWTTVIGFLIGICAIVMATFSTGIDSQAFQFRKDEVQLEDDIPYHYGFFHLIFSLGSMYFAMLFVGWDLDGYSKKWIIDVGWASTWVKILNEWFAASVYLSKLISPVLRQRKVVNLEENLEGDEPRS